jgi:hypothetical protein
MDAQVEVPTAAQREVWRAMLTMLFPRATAADLLRLSPPPPWICAALKLLALHAGLFLRTQRHAPRRAELARRLARVQEDIDRLPPLISIWFYRQLGCGRCWTS